MEATMCQIFQKNCIAHGSFEKIENKLPKYFAVSDFVPNFRHMKDTSYLKS